MADMTGNFDAIEESLTEDGMARNLIRNQGDDDVDFHRLTRDGQDMGTNFTIDGEAVDAEDVIAYFHGGESAAEIWLDDQLDVTFHGTYSMHTGRWVVESVDVLVSLGGPTIRVRFWEHGSPARIIGSWWLDGDRRNVADEIGVGEYLFSLAEANGIG